MGCQELCIFSCLLGRQPKLDTKSMQTEITILFPIFTTFQMLFYVGWLKVGVSHSINNIYINDKFVIAILNESIWRRLVFYCI